MDSSSSKIVFAASSVFQEVDTVDDKLLSLPRRILKLELMFIFGTLPRPPDSDLRDGFWFNLRSMNKICIQLQDVSGLSYFFTSLVLRNQALLCASRDSDFGVRYHLACGKRDDISGYALRQGELIWSNNIMELASMIFANDQSSFEVLFSIDKKKAAATLVFWTRYNGFRASVSLICEAYLLSVAAGIWLVASLPLREAHMSNNEFNLLKQFCVPVLHLSSSLAHGSFITFSAIEAAALVHHLSSSVRLISLDQHAYATIDFWEEKKKNGEEDMLKLLKENCQYDLEISALRQELETTKREYKQQCSQMESKTMTEKTKWEEQWKNEEEDMAKLSKENDQFNLEVSALRKELDKTKKAYEQQCLQMQSQTTLATTGLESRLKELEQERKDANTAKTSLEERVNELEKMGKEAHTAKEALEEKLKELQEMEKETKSVNTSLEGKIQELEDNLVNWKNKVKEMDEVSESKQQSWSQKEVSYKRFIDYQSQTLEELRFYSSSIKQEILKVQENYTEQFSQLGNKLIELSNAAENYHAVLTENRKLFNELQELKGNIRVFCRVRPFLPGQGAPNTVVEYVGEDGELVVTNPTRPGKDGLRKFRFNKVYSPAATQADVFTDIKPLVRSVLDGFNVCIFAYGQTGSGKTYTMTGPDGASEEDWGVNYRALNDLFKISQSRKGNINYVVGVQMVEIYNEQVLDLLSDDSSQKKLGILSTTSENGLAVPDASMYPVKSTSDVITLMDIGLQNRSVGATAMNERSSRSHSIVTVHVRGKDTKTGSVLYGNLHLVDLAGSERVDRSEVKGDRLREAQHINKSLSSLGDVIFSLASKSSHIPYRNSKLTQLLQSSLGGQAKTLMFVQLNPDAISYSESMSTLKFAERVSGVELGAAKSSKDGKDVRDLMEQLASLKDTIARKDEEIERLHSVKDIQHPQRPQKPMVRIKSLGQTDDINSETGEYSSQSRHAVTDGESLASSVEAESEERLSEVTSDAASIGTQGSPDVAKRPPKSSDRAKTTTSRSSAVTRPFDKIRKVATRTTSTVSKVASGLASSSSKKTSTASSLSKSSKRWA